MQELSKEQIKKLLELLSKTNNISISYIQRYLPAGYSMAVSCLNYLINEHYVDKEENKRNHRVYNPLERKVIKKISGKWSYDKASIYFDEVKKEYNNFSYKIKNLTRKENNGILCYDLASHDFIILDLDAIANTKVLFPKENLRIRALKIKKNIYLSTTEVVNNFSGTKAYVDLSVNNLENVRTFLLIHLKDFRRY